MSSDKGNGSAEPKFYALFGQDDDDKEKFIRHILSKLEAKRDIEIYYTDVPDMRVKALKPSVSNPKNTISKVVLKVDWQTRNRQFVCLVYAQVHDVDAKLHPVFNDLYPLKTELRFSNAGSDYFDCFLKAIENGIERYRNE